MRIERDDLSGEPIIRLLERHLEFARATSPSCHVHALDLEGLRSPEITFWTIANEAEPIGCAAIRQLDETHGEIKSMHVAAESRGQGVGHALVEFVIAEAVRRGYHRLSLETGTQDGFIPARKLYERFGFVRCEPFGDYWENPYSMCMTMELPKAG